MNQLSKPVTGSSISRPRLREIVLRHLAHAYQRPLKASSANLLRQLSLLTAKQTLPLILDAGCGTGFSTQQLAIEKPHHFVLGIDKSAIRLVRGANAQTLPENAAVFRAELQDVFRMAAYAKWPVAELYLLYPNPWPKAEHIQRRWYGHPVFPYLLACGALGELRSNWPKYMEEFAYALELAGATEIQLECITPAQPISLFEKKYAASGHTLSQLRWRNPIQPAWLDTHLEAFEQLLKFVN